jgi:hypothetical protein
MKTNRGPFLLWFIGAFALAFGLIGRPVRAEELVERKLGVGYKVGNGIGFEGGDLIYRAFPHVSFELQINYCAITDSLPDGTALSFSGVGFAPAVHAQLRPLGHTPYLSAGLIYVRMDASHEGDSVGNTSGAGFFANAGYEWRFASGIGVIVGAGVNDILTLHAETAFASATKTGNEVNFNLEGGIRYYF